LADTPDLRRQLQDARGRIAALETELAEARRQEALARLTGSVAHDFGNVLAAISGYNDLMLRSLASGSPLRRGAESIQKAVEWGHRLARQLLATGAATVERPSTDVNGVVSGVVRTLGPILGQRISIDLRLDPNVGAVGLSAAALEQVAMNLVLNARDAMPSGGRLTVATMASGANGNGSESAMLSVEDTGVGMDEATRARAFEPYFTTKESGKGTGLGLSTVFGILKQHGGHVDVMSEPGRGSTFRVCLPVVAAARAVAPSAAASPTVLVVEEEPGVRDLIVEILEVYHYRALHAGDAEEALGVCAREPAGIALVVADLGAPGIAGGPFAEWLRAVAPEAKILYLTEGSDRGDDGSAALSKPFTVEALAEKVREVLGRSATTG
jgi:two-component system, cell cycle sensor histidine kinase and response regulator CckA